MSKTIQLELPNPCTMEEALKIATEQLTAQGHVAEQALEPGVLIVDRQQYKAELNEEKTGLLLVQPEKKYTRWAGVAGITAFFMLSAIPGVFIFIMMLMSAVPLPFQRALLAFYGLFYVTLCVRCFPIGESKRTKQALSLAAIGILAITAWNQLEYLHFRGLPILGEAEPSLSDYRPFYEENQLATLDGPASLSFTQEDNLPRLDGATALYPVYAAFVQATYPEDNYRLIPQDPNETNVACTKTGRAYQRLIDGETDIIFVAGPSINQLHAAAEAGVELRFTPIGREGFVFFVNDSNIKHNLTLEQVQGIYSGKITNWIQVGGLPGTIRAYQRPEGSGSQTALQNMMGELSIREPMGYETVGGMGGIIREVSEYRNQRTAIGFSFRYFSTEMVEDNKIRLLNINGVPPDIEHIRDGSYPLTSEFYAITTANETPEVQAFLDWILSPEGQTLIERTGYAPIGKTLEE